MGSELSNNTGINLDLSLATGLNLLAGLVLLFYGRAQKSEALKASGKHVLSDVVTTVGILLGLWVVHVTGVLWLDSLIAALAGAWLLLEAYKILRENSGALLDEADEKALDDLARVINLHQMSGVIDIHNVRMIRSGNFHHIDAHMVVPEFWDVASVHRLSEQFEEKVVADYAFEGEFAFHVDPCKKFFCLQCDIAGCGIRQADFFKTKTSTRQNLIKGPQYTNQIRGGAGA
jgi:cation diffusion facilitator family transporter